MCLCGIEYRDLVDEGHEGANVGDIFRCWEGAEGVGVGRQRTDSVWPQSETRPVHCFLTERELVWVLDDPVPTAEGEIIGDVLEHATYCRFVEDAVVYDSVAVLDINSDPVEAVGVGVAGGLVALWRRSVPVPTPRGEEGGEMTVSLTDSY